MTRKVALARTTDKQALDTESKRGSVPRIPKPVLDQLPNGPLRRVVSAASYEPSTVKRDALLAKLHSKFAHRLEYRSLTTSTPDRGKPIVGWFMYKEAFAASLVEAIVREADLRKGARVLDPFGGIG